MPASGPDGSPVARLRALADAIAASDLLTLSHVVDRRERAERAALELDIMRAVRPADVSDRELVVALDEARSRAERDEDQRRVLMDDGRAVPRTSAKWIKHSVARVILKRQLLELLLAVEHAADLIEAGLSAEAQLVEIVVALARVELMADGGRTATLLDDKLGRIESTKAARTGGAEKRRAKAERLDAVRRLSAAAPGEKRMARARWVFRHLTDRDRLQLERVDQVYHLMVRHQL